MAKLLVGVSGGIAAYKALELVRLATQAGHAVRVIQTQSSERFVGRASFAALSGAPVLTSEWEHDPARGAFPGDEAPAHDPIGHLELVANADLLLIAPASANTLAKLAHGHADNLLTAAALAARCPVVVAPAMNNHMYEHAATQANLEVLRARGVRVLEPGTGELASRGERGVGRLPEPAELLAAVEEALGERAAAARRPWSGLKVLVTAGGTREPIDSVRYVGNRSSGRMGWALAAEAARRGAEVVVVAANVALAPTPGVQHREVATAAELAAACAEEFDGADVLLMAAAVADFRPAGPARGKLKKDRGAPELVLEPTVDVLAALSERRRDDQTLVGFAAEHGEEAVALGREKLGRKKLDLIVVNDISRNDIGFDATANEVTVIGADGAQDVVARAPKAEIAARVLDAVERVRSGRRTVKEVDGAAGSAAPGRPARV
ncbi:MAG: phosphopantothenoylcysteine decarboxylase / phosphopantothenate---cysteine ligase [Solirubrobacteraceae bacterium]|jgi:phosphopantothenoylcysteine decarboxylase/phosphopantothenate--cysteine ligase|nr:phosphopantothenoylcysteine decarboxylase / phosphopantothenate---cysteine ligase [Solirubrobacteraceae bacterium]